jgi:FkbM family methyltransferase
MQQPIISFAIPTYNRSAKLARLLKLLYAQLGSVETGAVEVIISNNCSTDDTSTVMEAYAVYGVRSFHQGTNLGLDGNLRFLYEQARGQYVWFFGDDDILLPGALVKVIQALNAVRPDVLLFSFAQPPGKTEPSFDTPGAITVIKDVRKTIDLVLKCTKISIYVIAKQHAKASLSPAVPVNTNYDFVVLALSALQRSECPTLCILREQLASCDDEYCIVRYDPVCATSMWKVAEHPFAQQHYPELMRLLKEKCQREFIGYMLTFRDGRLTGHPEFAEAYQAAIGQLTFQQRFRHDTRALLRGLFVRLGLIRLKRATLIRIRGMKRYRQDRLQRWDEAETTLTAVRSLVRSAKGRLVSYIHALRPRHIAWHIRRRLYPSTPVITRLGHKGELNIRIYPNGDISEAIYQDGVFEANEVELVTTLLEPGMVFVDAGANLGQYTLLGAHKVGNSGHVHGFEPSARVFKELEYNVALNGLADVCTLNNIAVSDKIGIARLSQYPPGAEGYGSLGNAHWAAEPLIGFAEVATITLDSYCRENGVPRVDLIKMDIEGCELPALRGAEQLLKGPESPAIVLEMADQNTVGFDYKAMETWEYLEALGYRFYTFGRRGRTIEPTVRPLDFSDSQNLLAVRPPVRPSWQNLFRNCWWSVEPLPAGFKQFEKNCQFSPIYEKGSAGF